jgi:hypothetical protein
MTVVASPIILPKSKREPTQRDPGLLVLYGQSKVGKTHILTKLDNCLIIDTEGGTKTHEALTYEVNSLKELVSLIQELRKPENKDMYKYIAVDTLDNVVNWYEASVATSYGVKGIGDVPYGAGYGVHREKVMNFMKVLRSICPRIILTGHRKKAIIGDTSVEVQTTSLDLMGKLKNIVSAESDAIGYIFRRDGKLHVSFETSDELEVGSRCMHLSGKVLEFDWNKIYID